MGLFGWSLPAGCGTLPGEEDEMPDRYTCPKCDARIDIDKPSEVTTAEDWNPFDPEFHSKWNHTRINPETGVKEVLEHAENFFYYDCPNCGHRSEQGELVGWFEDEDDDMEELKELQD